MKRHYHPRRSAFTLIEVRMAYTAPRDDEPAREEQEQDGQDGDEDYGDCRHRGESMRQGRRCGVLDASACGG